MLWGACVELWGGGRPFARGWWQKSHAKHAVWYRRPRTVITESPPRNGVPHVLHVVDSISLSLVTVAGGVALSRSSRAKTWVGFRPFPSACCLTPLPPLPSVRGLQGTGVAMNGRLLSADGSTTTTAPLTLPPEALTAPDRAATAAEPWVRGVPPRPSAAPDNDDDEDEDNDEAVRAVAFQASGMDEYLCGLTPDALTPPPLSVSIPPVSVPAPATAAVAPVAPAAPVWHACPSAHTPRTPRGSVGAPGASIGEARRVHAGSTPKDAPEEPRAAPPLSLSGRFSSRITRLIDRRHRATGSASAALAVPRRGVCVVPPAPGVYPPAAVSPSLSPSLSPSPSPPSSPSPSRPPFPATATAAREDEDDRAPEGDVFPGAGAALPRGVVLRILGFLGPCDLARA